MSEPDLGVDGSQALPWMKDIKAEYLGADQGYKSQHMMAAAAARVIHSRDPPPNHLLALLLHGWAPFQRLRLDKVLRTEVSVPQVPEVQVEKTHDRATSILVSDFKMRVPRTSPATVDAPCIKNMERRSKRPWGSRYSNP